MNNPELRSGTVEAAGHPCFVMQERDAAGRPGKSYCGQWSGTKQGFPVPPAIGERVKINFNEFGAGVVLGYFIEGAYLGIIVKCDARPAWHVKQNGDKHHHPYVFGAEIRQVNEGGAR